MKILCLFDPCLHFFWQHLPLSVVFFVWQNFANCLRNLSKVLSKADKSAFFKIIGKLLISKLDCLKLSVIWRSYRYRYQNWQKNYRKIFVIKKMTYRWPLVKEVLQGAHLLARRVKSFLAKKWAPAQTTPILNIIVKQK